MFFRSTKGLIIGILFLQTPTCFRSGYRVIPTYLALLLVIK